jgi:hypothetical protein
MTLDITIASRRSSTDKLQQKFPQARIIDVTSRGSDPWVRFSPFYPHGNIPVPLSAGLTAASVEGIWQALKVFETCDIDKTKFSVSTMKGIKRTSRSHGKVLGHRAGVNGDHLLGYLDARKLIYLPAYHWVLENCVIRELEELRVISSTRPLFLLDYETNCDINNLSSPLSHAGLIKRFLNDDWPRA